MVTNPNDPTESNSSNHSPYPLSETSTGFSFITDKGAVYEVAFRDDSDYFPAQSLPVPVFSFTIAHVSGEIGPRDFRIEATVVNILSRTFDATPKIIITYTCSTENKQGFQRSIAFRRWFSRNKHGFVMLDYADNLWHEYAAAIFRENHPDG